MRYLPLSANDRSAMLAEIGAESIDDLFVDVPEAARLSAPIAGLPSHASEIAVERDMAAMARRNRAARDHPCFLGAGAYHHHIPATVDYLIQRGEFLTSYTPYQPEIAQGTLQTLFEFQSQVARLYGCDIANASLYDGSTACWEAISMAGRITRRRRMHLAGGLHPHYRAVAETMARHAGYALSAKPLALSADMQLAELSAAIDDNTAAVVVQYPDILGRIADLSQLAEVAHRHGALLIAIVTEAVALGAIQSPGEMGADIVAGEGQSLGVGLQFGGPYVGLFACRERFVRQMPGRLCGQTVDSKGKRGFVLTLAAREQHIRREKATSNICTNSGLCALAFSIHMSLLGEAGLRRLAMVNHRRTCALAERLNRIAGVEVVNATFFNEFAVRLPMSAARAVDKLAAQGILAGVPLRRLYPQESAPDSVLDGAPDIDNVLLVAVTEMASDEDMARLVDSLAALAIQSTSKSR